MARFGILTLFLFVSLAVFSVASDSSLLKAVPKSQRAAGVFVPTEGGEYNFNHTAARAACLSLNVTIATRSQMERAVQHGLETCRFGWIHEQIVVVPRLTSETNCGKGKTGVVTWNVTADRKYGVFCFNASDLEETPTTSTTRVRVRASSSTTSPLVVSTQTPSPPAATPLLRSTTNPPSRFSKKPKTTKSPQHVPLTSAFTLPVKKTPSTVFSSTSPPLKPSSTRTSTSLSDLITSSSSPAVTSLASSTSVHASSFSESVQLQTVNSTKPAFGVVPTVIIILAMILLVVTAAAAVWYYKLSVFPFRPQGHQKDGTGTEMWKQTGSEMDLHVKDGPEEEDNEEEEEEDTSDRKYSGDVMLFVNPSIKTFSSE